jgi:hypothetical protein
VPALIVTILYAVLPGHPDLPVRGLPFGVLELAGLVAIVLLFAATRSETRRVRTSWTPVVVLVSAALLKCLLAFAWYPAGWLSRYYANDGFREPFERSTDSLPWPLSRRWADAATRIDKTIDFRGASFPVHFLNDDRFGGGRRREITEAFSIEWRGTIELGGNLTPTLILTARGSAELLIDGQTALAVDSPGEDGEHRAELRLARGPHAVTVRYRKPVNTEGFVRLSRLDAGSIQVMTDPRVLPALVSGWRRAVAGLLPAAGWMGHGAALLAVLSWLGPLVRTRVAQLASRARAEGSRGLRPLIAPVVVTMLLGQGLVQARPLAERVLTLEAGDVFTVEAEARQIAAGGPSLDAGFASHFVAGIHIVTGESMAGVALITFCLCALAAVALHRLAETLAGPMPALLGLAATLVFQQIALARAGPLGVWPEILYATAVAVAAMSIARVVQSHRRARTRGLTQA